MKIMIMFCSNASVSSVAQSLGLARSTVTDYFDNLRGIWMDDLENDPIVFLSNGEYEVDECLVKHVVDVRNNGYRLQWIGGILERETGQVLLYRVSDRSTRSLIQPIVNNVPRGSFIYSDEWTVYRALERQNLGPFVHLSVCHSKGEYQRTENVGGENLNVHINTLEGINAVIRRALRNKSRRNKERIDLVLGEIMYRQSGRSLFAPFKCKK